MAFRQDTDKRSMMTTAGGWDVLDPVIAGQPAPLPAQPTPANEELETQASSEAEPALQRDEEAVTGPYSNSSAGSFDHWSTQQRRQEAAEKSGFAIANQGPTNQETEDDRERKKEDTANDALAEMVELGREQRKREWEKQVVRLGNFQISKGELARYGRELEDQKTYDAYEEYLIGLYGEKEGRRRAREFREYTYITNLQSEGAATPEQNARRSELETTRGSELGESARAYQNWQNKFQPSAPRLQQGGVQTERGVSGASAFQGGAAIESQSNSLNRNSPVSYSIDPLLENPIQAKSLRSDFIKVSSEQGETSPATAVINPAPAKIAKWEATGLSV